MCANKEFPCRTVKPRAPACTRGLVAATPPALRKSEVEPQRQNLFETNPMIDLPVLERLHVEHDGHILGDV